jgi:hypothetical protein
MSDTSFSLWPICSPTVGGAEGGGRTGGRWRLYGFLILERSDLAFELLDLLPKFRDLIL